MSSGLNLLQLYKLFDLIFEAHYSTRITQISQASTEFVKEWLKFIQEKVHTDIDLAKLANFRQTPDISNQYISFGVFCYYLSKRQHEIDQNNPLSENVSDEQKIQILSNREEEQTELSTKYKFETKINVKNHEITYFGYIFNIPGTRRSLGITNLNKEEPKKSTIGLALSPNNIAFFASLIKQCYIDETTNSLSSYFKAVALYVRSLKRITSHETEHWFQHQTDWKGDKRKKDYSARRNLRYSQSQALNSDLSYFVYASTDVEVDAQIYAAMKEYRSGKPEEDFIQALYITFKNNTQIAFNLLTKKASLIDYLKDERKRFPVIYFLFMWILYDYIPNKDSQGWMKGVTEYFLYGKTRNGEEKPKVIYHDLFKENGLITDPSIIKENYRSIYTLIQSLSKISPKTLSFFSNTLGNRGEVVYGLFSTTKKCSNYVSKLIEYARVTLQKQLVAYQRDISNCSLLKTLKTIKNYESNWKQMHHDVDRAKEIVQEHTKNKYEKISMFDALYVAISGNDKLIEKSLNDQKFIIRQMASDAKLNPLLLLRFAITGDMALDENMEKRSVVYSFKNRQEILSNELKNNGLKFLASFDKMTMFYDRLDALISYIQRNRNLPGKIDAFVEHFYGSTDKLISSILDGSVSMDRVYYQVEDCVDYGYFNKSSESIKSERTTSKFYPIISKFSKEIGDESNMSWTIKEARKLASGEYKGKLDFLPIIYGVIRRDPNLINSLIDGQVSFEKLMADDIKQHPQELLYFFVIIFSYIPYSDASNSFKKQINQSISNYISKAQQKYMSSFHIPSKSDLFDMVDEIRRFIRLVDKSGEYGELDFFIQNNGFSDFNQVFSKLFENPHLFNWIYEKFNERIVKKP